MTLGSKDNKVKTAECELPSYGRGCGFWRDADEDGRKSNKDTDEAAVHGGKLA